MQTVGLDQNTLAWLEARKKYIGGSDVPSIMMASPWRTVHELWEEKLGICTPDHADKAYIFWKGHRMEDIARQKLELQIGFDIPPQVIRSQVRPYAQVSLDCFNEEEAYVGEVKFMGKADWELLREFGEVPEKYIPQVQYQLLCTGFKELHFIGINNDKKLATTLVKPDLEMMKKIIAHCDKFWDLVQSRTPPKQFQQDYKFLQRVQAKKDLNRIFRIDKKIGELFEEREKLQDSVLKAAKSTRMAFERKIMINVSHFDSQEDLKLITELDDTHLKNIGRSIQSDLKLIVIKNNRKDIKGAPSVKKAKRRRKAKKRSGRSKKATQGKG